jgi:hypothetical protein
MATIYSNEGLILEQSDSSNYGIRFMSHYKRVTALNQTSTLVRFAVSGNSQNVFLSLYMKFNSDRQSVNNNFGSYGFWRWAGCYCNSSGTMFRQYESAYNGEWGGGGPFPEFAVSSNYVDATVYLWSEAQDCVLPLQVCCSDWSKVTVTYY